MSRSRTALLILRNSDKSFLSFLTKTFSHKVTPHSFIAIYNVALICFCKSSSLLWYPLTSCLYCRNGVNFLPEKNGLPKHTFISLEAVHWAIDKVEGINSIKKACDHLEVSPHTVTDIDVINLFNKSRGREDYVKV